MAKIHSKIPIIKKKISAFLSKEDGKISKENLIKAGVAVALISIAADSVVAGVHTSGHYSGTSVPLACYIKPGLNSGHSVHDNDLQLSYALDQVTGTHNHCAGSATHGSHTSHSSHGSHGSHGQW